MLKDSKEVVYFIVFQGIVFSFVGGAYKNGVLFFALSVLLFALLIVFVFFAYAVIRRGVYYVKDLFKTVNIALEKEEKKENKQIRK